ncbi:MAG: SPOR domain-containing protein, partial [Bacteroidia bacterium]
LQIINDSLKNHKPDTVKIIETVEVPAPVEIPEEEPAAPEPIIDVYTPDPDKIYLVQIGSFKFFDLSRFQPGMESMEQYKINGLNTITIGRFSTQKEAELFAKDIVALGIKSPLIAKLENGIPVVIKPKVVKKTAKKTVKKTTTKKRR